MKFSTGLSLLISLVPYALALPMIKRADADILVFTFADVLEQLESQFYSAALSKFQDADFTGAGFTAAVIPSQQFATIQLDEAAHSTILQATLRSFNAEPVTSCQFNFDSALGDVATMAATARVVEYVGVTAYLGAAGLLTDTSLLTAAGSILTVEARHQTVLNILSGAGTAVSSPFDIAFTPSEVLAIASPFFVPGSCDLGVPANPTLSITNTGSVGPGTLLTFESAALNGTVPEDQLFCQMLIGGEPCAIALPLSQCIVPDNINGAVAIWITSDGQPVLNNVRDRATNKLVAGPTLTFIDTQPQMLGQVARASAGGATGGEGSGESTTTRTISPEEASAIISSAATATAGSEGASATPVNNPNAAVSSSPNLTTGKSADGKITVEGWTGL